ncbi:T9SS type A sorting domain-containing protein [bacterium]|nr:T9SS type A sorting domain-containing protein [bacterium]
MNRSLAPLYVLLLALTTGASPLTTHRTAVDIQVQDRGLSGVSIDFQIPTTTEMTNLESVADNLIYTPDGRQVPVIRRWVAVPPGHRVEAEVTERTSHQLTVSQVEGRHSYQSIQRSTIGTVQLQTFSLDPPEPVSVGRTIIFRGVPIAPVSIYPYQYSTDDENIIENNNLTVDFNFVADGSVNNDIRPIHDPPGSEPAMFLDNLVLNPPRRDYDEVQAMYLSRILIVHSSVLWDQAIVYVNKFADWKRRMGYNVDILVIDNIHNTGALDIRNIIRDEYYNVDYPYVPISYLIIFGQDEIHNNSYFPNGDGGDSYYALMDDGNAFAPDICVGRFDVSSISELQATVNRSIRYEQDPFRDDDHEDPLHWYSKAIFTAENAGHQSGQFVPSMIQMGRWTYDRLTRIKEPPYTDVDTLWATDEDNADIVPNTIEALQDGRSLALSRGELMGCLQGIHIEDDPTETGRKHPFTCALTCLTATRQQKFFRSGHRSAAEANGPIAALAMIDLTNTRTSQCVMGWIVRAIAYEEMVQPGWIQLYSKLHLYGDYQDDQTTLGLVETTLSTYRLLGDPSVNVFTSRPVEITASYPESIIPGATALNIQVGSQDGIYEDAIVCVRQVESENQFVTTPGDDGWARFTMPPGWIEEDSLLLTITHPNTFPIVETIYVAEQEVMIELDSVRIDDGENSLIPGESRAVTLTLKNSGNSDSDDLVLHISTEDPWISFDEEEIELESIASDSNLITAFNLIVSPSSKPPRWVRIDLAVTSGETEWSHSFMVFAFSHQLNLRWIEFSNGDFEPGNSVRMMPELENMGNWFSPAASAKLVCLYPRSVTVTEDIAGYSVIAPERYDQPSNNGYFTVELSENAIPGDSARFRLELFDPDDDEGFRDSVYFNYMIGNPNVRDPYGPDEYGYMCFDSGDEGWERAPVYDWIEINPSFDGEADFQGTRLLFEDNHEGRDSSTVFELPFDFGYYGESFRDLVICTNGWIAFGEENSHYHTFRNWTIPGIVGPDAQIAVHWQDLKTTSPFDQRGVYYFYDEHGGRFIVEWSNMQIFHGDGGNIQPDDHLIEFQVILYDPVIHHTTTGDGEIKMQYKTFDDFGGNGNDNQYMTIGLKNLDNTGGLQYRYWNYSDERCMPLENETALLFTVDVSIEYGSLEGRVAVADDTSHVLENVHVYTRRGYETYTGENGLFRIDDIAAGGETVYFELDDYNTMSVDVTIEPDSTVWIDMLMTYPLIRVSLDSIYGEARPDSGCGGPLIAVHNDGIGDLDFNVEHRYRDGSQTRFEQVWSLGTDTFTDFEYVLGCQFVGDEIYVTYTQSYGMNGIISVINRDGEEVRSFEQPVVNQTFGFIDLAFDGEYLYGGDYEILDNLTYPPMLVKFDLEGNLIDQIQIEGVNENELPYAKALAYDPVNEYFYLANSYKKIFVMQKNGVPVSRFYVPLPTGRPNIQGMAWNQCDDDNMPLYIMDWVSEDDERRMRIIKMNPVSLDIKVVGDISVSDRDKGKGLSVGFDWDGGFTRLASISDCSDRDETRDTLRIFEIGPDTRFLEIIDGTNSVHPNEAQSITLIMTAYTDLEVRRTYSVGLRINHNARGEAKLVPIDFFINPDSEIDSDIPTPLEFSLDPAYPNPFNSVTRIGYTLDITGNVSLKIFDLTGRLVEVLVDGETPAGNHNVLFKPDKLASGIYFYRLEAGDRSIIKRMVLLR